MILESMARTHGFDAMGLDPMSDSPHNLMEETSMRAAQLHEIGEGLDSYAWSF